MKFRKLKFRLFFLLAAFAIFIYALYLIIYGTFFEINPQVIGAYFTSSSKIHFVKQAACEYLEINDVPIGIDGALTLAYVNTPITIDVNASENFTVTLGIVDEGEISIESRRDGSSQFITVYEGTPEYIRFQTNKIDLHYRESANYFLLNLCLENLAYWPTFQSADYGFTESFDFEAILDPPSYSNIRMDIGNVTDLEIDGTSIIAPSEIEISFSRYNRLGEWRQPFIRIITEGLKQFPSIGPGLDLLFLSENPEAYLESAIGRSPAFTVSFPEGWVEINGARKTIGTASRDLFLEVSLPESSLVFSEIPGSNSLFESSIEGYSSNAVLDKNPLILSEWNELDTNLQNAYIAMVVSVLLAIASNSSNILTWVRKYVGKTQLRFGDFMSAKMVIFELKSRRTFAGEIVSHKGGYYRLKKVLEWDGGKWQEVGIDHIDLSDDAIEVMLKNKQ